MTKKVLILNLLFFWTVLCFSQDQKLGKDYLATYLSPISNIGLSIKSDNNFRITQTTKSGNTVKELALIVGKYTVENDTLKLISEEKVIGQFLISKNLSLKPIYYFIPETSDWFLIQYKFSLKGRFLGEGKWLGEKKLGTWLYSDKKYKDVKKPSNTSLKYYKIKGLPASK